MKEIKFVKGKWQFDVAMQDVDWDTELFDCMVDKTVKKLDAAEKNEFWRQYNEWARLAQYTT